jgi:hypothetical protein
LVLVVGISAVPHASWGAVTGDPEGLESCVVNLATHEVECFEDIQALVEARTDGAVSDVRTVNGLTRPATIEAIEAAQASVVAAVFWNVSGYEGASLLMEAPHGCDADPDADWGWNSIVENWRNKFNSGRGYSQCQFKVWDHPSYFGAEYGWNQESASFGVMNNAAESVKLR